MEGRNKGWGFILLALGLAGCNPPPPLVPVQVVVTLGMAQGGEDSRRSVGEVVTVWLTKPVVQQLDYNPQTYEAKGVVMVEAGENIFFQVEARRRDGVALYRGETFASVKAGVVNQVSLTLRPLLGPLDITANVHEVTGPPTLRFTHVPPRGSFEDLEGVVENINPALVTVAVYIEVDGRWWTKPYWAAPKTPVSPKGTWLCDITTGGHDQDATRIRAYLIRQDYNPPLAPQEGLPPDPPTPEVLAMVEVSRE